MQKNYFPQIEGLRALAVCAVIVYHYREAWLPAGYLGVDIFFVISGFVISGTLSRSVAGNWRDYLVGFYVKRIKRLLPALLFCVIVTSITLLVLTTRPSEDAFRTGAMALFGLSNIYLLGISADYFALDSSLNAFTHTWSLGVEEQFYLFYPILLFALGMTRNQFSRSGLRVIVAITLVSLAVFVMLSQHFPLASFYLLPARAWELGAGALTYYVVSQKSLPMPKWLSWCSLMVVIATLFLPSSLNITATILAVTGTAVLIASCSEDTTSYRLLTLRPFMLTGLLSYSLYLWHWPVLVLGKLTIGTFGWALPILIFLTVVMSVISYICVERPLRYAQWFESRILTIIFSASISILLSIAIWNAGDYGKSENNLIASYFNIQPVDDTSMDYKCHGKKKAEAAYKNPLHGCLGANRSDAKPGVVYLIGDSHAAQLYDMFGKAFADTRYTVKFLNLGYKHFPRVLLEEDRRSIILDYIAEHAQTGDVLVIAFHRGRMNSDRDKHIPISSDIELEAKASSFIDNMSTYIALLQAKEVRTFFVRDTPLMNTVATSPSCLLQIKLFGESTCRVSKEQDLRTRKQQDLAYDILASRFSSVCTWDPLEALYRGKSTFEIVDDSGQYVMRDWNHISSSSAARLEVPFMTSFNRCVNNKPDKQPSVLW